MIGGGCLRPPSKPYILKSGTAEITHALSDDVVTLLAGDDGSVVANQRASPCQLPLASVVSLNRLLQEGQLLHELHHNRVVGIGSDTVVKIGSDIDPDHANNLQHINEHVPGIPTPRFLGGLSSCGLAYIFLSRPQVTPQMVWPDFTVGQKLPVKRQLTEHLKRLRAEPPPRAAGQNMRLGSFKSGICKDMRRSQRESSAPLHTEAEWNDFLCRESGRATTAWTSMVRSFMAEDHRVVMTHGDLHPATSCTIGPRELLKDWVDDLPTDAVGHYPVDFSLDCLISRWLG
ncbi:hypothetical protein MAPG_00108 [Magnaporthiopsis poae ATCC 64411]|uniref:Aminoglycoside phosphotransferase domain-containing protein n=1 Tax=Magnaporthiopsis poae (strain ATCC 64411 / 73-15) TaxID=644358 RepID=A0A0C4DK46_MAGP6|nr:hypothetical protein MAPG_00108 [Magnaporthiopsis poae ATCC 64411]